MAAKRIAVLGAGFAGLWSAVGAARKLDELGIDSEEVEVTLVNRDAWHGIRVRNYEADLSAVRVPLDAVLAPIGVKRVEAEVEAIDPTRQQVTLGSANGTQTLAYDRLVLALGSQLVRPNLPGLAEYAFDVDTYNHAARLHEHLGALAARPAGPGCYTVVVIGAGLTGIEVATEMTARLRDLADAASGREPPRVILVDHNPYVGSDMGEAARPVIEHALRDLNVETRLGERVAAVHADRLEFASGETIATSTVIWCAGMRAHPLTAAFPVTRDRFGRLPVDDYLRMEGVPHVFAAGDVAVARMDDEHRSVMSCQHGRPMGRYAGHNVVCDLLGLPMLPLRIEWYVTVLDLGPWGALYTEGWDRHVVAQGQEAKRTKQIINCERIYPPLDGDRAKILAAAAPEVQQPPTVKRD